MGNNKEKLSRIVGLRLLAIREGAECGAIREVVMDVVAKSVRYFVLDTGKGCFGFRVLPNAKIAGFGEDFAITESSDFVTDIWQEEEALKLGYTDSDLIGARVVSSSGDVVGNIVDFEFEVGDGTITRYIMEDGEELPGESVVTLSHGIVFIDKERIVGEDAPAAQSVQAQIAAALLAEMPVAQQAAPVAPAIPVAEAPPAPAPVVQEEPVASPQTAPAEEVATIEAVKEDTPVADEPVTSQPTSTQSGAAGALASRLAALKTQNKPEAVPADADENGDMKDYFEKRRTEFLIGKKVKQRIAAADGTVLADAGQIVTADMIEKVKEADKIIELTMGVN